MRISYLSVLLFLVLLASGCTKQQTAGQSALLAFYPNDSSTPQFRSDGEGPFPAAWPTYAALVQSAWDGTNANQHLYDDATLVLAVSPEEIPHSGTAIGKLLSNPGSIRFVVPYRSALFEANWASLYEGNNNDLFVYTSASGGSMPLVFTIIKREVIFPIVGSDHQGHHYRIVLETNTIEFPVFDYSESGLLRVYSYEQRIVDGGKRSRQILYEWDEGQKAYMESTP